MIILYDYKMRPLTELGKHEIVSSTEVQELGGQVTCDVTLPYKLLDERSEYFSYTNQNNKFLYKIITIKKEGAMAYIEGMHLFFYELKGGVIRDKRPTDKTAKEILEIILEGTEWTVVSDVQGKGSMNLYHISKLEAFYDFLKLFKCEFELEINNLSKIIYIKEHISDDFGKWFEYGDKLIKVVAEENKAEVFTGYIGMGKGEQTEGGGFGRKIKFDTIEWSTLRGDKVDKPLNQDFVEIKEATELYSTDGKPRLCVVEFNNITDRTELLEATYQYALSHSRPKVHLKAKAVSDKRVELGEMCSVIRPDLNIRYKTRVFKVKTDLLTQLQEFEFGERIYTTFNERLTGVLEESKKIIKESESKLVTALQEASKGFFGKNGFPEALLPGNEYGLPGGIYVFDKPIDQGPTAVVGIGGDGIIISNKKDPNGKWIVKTAINAEGIIGSEIIANTITANELSPDVGQVLDISANKSINSMVTSLEDTSNNLSRNIRDLNTSLDNINSSTLDKLAEAQKEYRLHYSLIKQELDNINLEFKSSGYANLIKNSVLSIKDDRTNTYLNWKGNRNYTSEVDITSIKRGCLSGRSIKFEHNNLDNTGLWLTQIIDVTPYSEADPNNTQLSFSLRIYKEEAGTCHIAISEFDGAKWITKKNIYLNNGDTSNYKKYVIEGYKAANSQLRLSLKTEGAVIKLTDLMLNRGPRASEWRQASGEMASAGANFSEDGMKVYSSKYEGDYTVMSPIEFAGYSYINGQLTKVFNLDKETLETYELFAKKGLQIPPLKLIPATRQGVKGWGIVKAYRS